MGVGAGFAGSRLLDHVSQLVRQELLPAVVPGANRPRSKTMSWSTV
jgi:hypothetical protein